MKFLKNLFKGLLYVILSPFFLAVFVVYFVVLIFIYIVEFIIACIKFFKGDKLSIELQEDYDLRRKLFEEAKKKAELEAEELAAPQVNNETINNTTNNTTTDNSTKVVNNYYFDASFFQNPEALKNFPVAALLQNPDVKQLSSEEIAEIEEKKTLEPIEAEEQKNESIF